LHFLALREVLLQGALLGGVEREDGRARAFVGAWIGGRNEEPPSSETSSGAISPLPWAAASIDARKAA
jgi:hypothetical protein